MSIFAGQYGPEPFVDLDGTPAPSITVTLRPAGDPDLAELWADRDRTAPLANPLPIGVPTGVAGVDVQGNVVFYADPGRYDITTHSGELLVYAGQIVVDRDPAEVLELVDGGPW